MRPIEIGARPRWIDSRHGQSLEAIPQFAGREGEDAGRQEEREQRDQRAGVPATRSPMICTISMFGPGATWPEAVDVDELRVGEPVVLADDRLLHLGQHRRAAADGEQRQQRERAGELRQRAHPSPRAASALASDFVGRYHHTASGPRVKSVTGSDTWKTLTAAVVSATNSRSTHPPSSLRPSW
jgi:hypothetical protein